MLLCLELMLNAANLALIGFSRMWGNSEGQVFAVIVMVVAACEVCIGLGMVVAIYRAPPADRRRRAAGAPGMTTTGWLILAFPLAGAVTIGLLFRRCPAKAAGWIGTAAIGGRVRLRRPDLLLAPGPRP